MLSFQRGRLPVGLESTVVIGAQQARAVLPQALAERGGAPGVARLAGEPGVPGACVEDVRVHGPGAVGVQLDEPFQVLDLGDVARGACGSAESSETYSICWTARATARASGGRFPGDFSSSLSTRKSRALGMPGRRSAPGGAGVFSMWCHMTA